MHILILTGFLLLGYFKIRKNKTKQELPSTLQMISTYKHRSQMFTEIKQAKASSTVTMSNKGGRL